MTPKLSWSKTWKNAAFQAKKSIACIFRYRKSFCLNSPQDIFKLFDSIVSPILTYGAEIWGYQYVEKIEKVQTKFCKQCLALSQKRLLIFMHVASAVGCLYVSFILRNVLNIGHTLL